MIEKMGYEKNFLVMDVDFLIWTIYLGFDLLSHIASLV